MPKAGEVLYFTAEQVQDILDEDRSKTFLVGLILCVVCAVGGFWAGIYFATNLYGG